MKKRTTTFILTLCMCLLLGLALTACNLDNTEPEHTHSFENVWSHDAEYHWYACEDAGCTEISKKSAHDFANNVCTICGYEEHQHQYSDAWSKDDTYHWYACEDVTCTYVSQKSEHTFVNDICSVCLFEREASAPQPSNDWEDYFVFDNVTATRTTVQNMLGTSNQHFSTYTETMHVANGKWLLSQKSENTFNSDCTEDKAYWDGEQLTTEIESTLTPSSLQSIGSNWFSEAELLSYLGESFEETSNGVFELAEQNLGSSTYSNIKIVIEDGYIQSIEYECEFESGGEIVVQNVEMTFSAWGQTSVQGFTTP